MNNEIEIVKEEVIETAAEVTEEVAVEAAAEVAVEEVAEAAEAAVEEAAEVAEEVSEAAVEETADVKAKVDAIVADALQKMDASLNKVKALVQDKVQKLREKLPAKEEANEESAEVAEEVVADVAEEAVADDNAEVAVENAEAADVVEELKKKGISLDDVKAALAKETAKAKAMIQDKEKMQNLANKAQKLCEKLANLPVVGRYFKDIPTLCQIIRDYVTGKYKECPLATIIAVTVALLYLINPFDLVPDAIPMLGVADDIAALTLVLEAARNDLESYRKWKAAQKSEEDK